MTASATITARDQSVVVWQLSVSCDYLVNVCWRLLETTRVKLVTKRYMVLWSLGCMMLQLPKTSVAIVANYLPSDLKTEKSDTNRSVAFTVKALWRSFKFFLYVFCMVMYNCHSKDRYSLFPRCMQMLGDHSDQRVTKEKAKRFFVLTNFTQEQLAPSSNHSSARRGMHIFP